MPAGRPPKFKTPDELESMVEMYVSDCAAKEEPLTITGLALYLGFCDRQSLYDYEERELFSCTIKRARLYVENSYEKRIEKGAGPIFALKNMGWSDRQELNHTSSDRSMSPQPGIDLSGLSTQTLLELQKLHDDQNPAKG